MLEKIEVVDRIEVDEKNCVHVRSATRVIEDGAVLSETYHRHVVVPGADYSAEDDRVKAVCAAVHTLSAIAAYNVGE